MTWLYKLQQRLSITRRESIAVLTLAVLFVLGLAVRHVQQQQVPPLAVDSLVAQPPSDSTAAPADAPINLTSAPRGALEALPGIGPALSERILTYRSSQRSFQRVDELQRVRGIGPKTLEDLRPMVRVAPPDTSAPDAPVND
jgi:competence protein ComEA